jgi:hypothetical protein
MRLELAGLPMPHELAHEVIVLLRPVVSLIPKLFIAVFELWRVFHVDDDSAVELGGAYTDNFSPLLFAISLKRAKFFCVNGVCFS